MPPERQSDPPQVHRVLVHGKHALQIRNAFEKDEPIRDPTFIDESRKERTLFGLYRVDLGGLNIDGGDAVWMEVRFTRVAE